MNEQKKSEVLAFFWFVVSVLTLLSLLSYTPDDISFEVSVPNSPTHNFVGIAGAYTAWALILFFGRTAYFLVPLFLFWALAKWSGAKGPKPWLRIFSTLIFLASACALFSLVGQESAINRFQFGGAVGFFSASFLTHLFGSAGFFVALSLFLLSIILATDLLVLQITAGLFKKVKAVLPEGAPAAAPVKPAEKKASILEKLKPQVKLPELKPKAQEKPKAEPVQSVKPQIRVALPKEPPVKAPEPPKAKPLIQTQETPQGSYAVPTIDLFESPPAMDHSKVRTNLEESSRVLEDTLRDFGIDAKVEEVEQGPTITRYELQPAAGVKVQKITALENDIALAMRATSVRIVAPIPGKSRVGIEVPNSAASTVYIREILTSPEFQNETSKIAIVIGKDTAGAPLVCNLADMPHLLIAGATNTGKSVCINSVLTSILFRSTPEEVRFMLIDPKMVELHFYNDLPHLICPVVTDKAKVPGALAWLVAEMERRYKLLSKVGAKNILAFNGKVERNEIKPETIVPQTDPEDTEPIIIKKMPYILIVIDELADLMLASAQEVEAAITRLAQLARAVGIHMILATQRPSVDVITGVIKANFPARIAFQVASKVDSRTILDENGADKLLG
ncbi:MAG: DNA translocase FtsK 4TM domain-containing protein, partial [Candidatus Omnitrophota bacterium]